MQQQAVPLDFNNFGGEIQNNYDLNNNYNNNNTLVGYPRGSYINENQNNFNQPNFNTDNQQNFSNTFIIIIIQK